MTREKIEKGQGLVTQIDQIKDQINTCLVEEQWKKHKRDFSIHINNRTSNVGKSSWLDSSLVDEVVELIIERLEEKKYKLEKELAAL